MSLKLNNSISQPYQSWVNDLIELLWGCDTICSKQFRIEGSGHSPLTGNLSANDKVYQPVFLAKYESHTARCMETTAENDSWSWVDDRVCVIFSCDQAALWMVQSVHPSVTPCLLCSHHHIIMQFSGVITILRSGVHAKVNDRGQRSRSQRSKPSLTVSVEFTYGNKIMHTVWSSIEEVTFCSSRSSVKFQGHTGNKIADFDPNVTFPDCNNSLNWPMAMKWCTKIEVV